MLGVRNGERKGAVGGVRNGDEARPGSVQEIG